MNYYKFNIGDYAAATRHLTMLEHGAYRLLLDIYYTSERPIEKNFKKIGARGKEETRAVEFVLSEFFTLTEDGWVHKRCEKELAAYAKKAEVNAAIGKMGGRPKKTVQKQEQNKNPNGFEMETQTVSENNPNHKPLTNNHKPLTNTKGEVLEASCVHAHETPPPPTQKTFPPLDELDRPPPDTPESKQPSIPTMYGATCIALKAVGIANVAPGNLDFRALVDAGIGIDVFTQAAAKAVANGKGRFDYVLAVVKGQVKDAQATAEAAKSATPLRAIAGGKASPYQSPLKATDGAAEAEKARRMLFGGAPVDEKNIVDVDARFVRDVQGVTYA